MERYDLTKMKSYLSINWKTNYAHSRYPSLWNNLNNPNILNIASTEGVEFIDIRQKSGWKVNERLDEMLKSQVPDNIIYRQFFKY